MCLCLRRLWYINELIVKTEEFFHKHWNDEKNYPAWKNRWDWSSSVPYHNKAGVYALFDESGRLLYIGLGASVRSVKYQEHGVSRRLLSHVIKKDPTKKRTYAPRKKWASVSGIGAIGFDYSDSYLAAALEVFLIRQLKPPMNNVGKIDL